MCERDVFARLPTRLSSLSVAEGETKDLVGAESNDIIFAHNIERDCASLGAERKHPKK